MLLCTYRKIAKDSGLDNAEIKKLLSFDYTDELCPHCDTEVQLPLDLGIYKCSSCGKDIVNCSMCFDMNCSDCGLNKTME